MIPSQPRAHELRPYEWITMPTLHLSPADAALAGALLRSGKLVAFPTETVYGLGANALDAHAVQRIFEAKGRPADNPLIAHITDVATLDVLCRDIPDTAYRLADAFWPGPLTMALPRTAAVPDIVTAGLPTVAVRLPLHPVARAIIRAAGVPIAAPSANVSGRPSPTSAAHVLADFEGRIDAVVDGGGTEIGVESTVVAVEGNRVTVLRPGGITVEMLRDALPDVEIALDPGVMGVSDGPVRSPGMKYRHYAPRAPLAVYRGAPDATAARILDEVRACASISCAVLCFDEYADAFPCPTVPYGSAHDPAAQAHRLFDALRRLDVLGAGRLFAQCPDDAGVGMAVANRLMRAGTECNDP